MKHEAQPGLRRRHFLLGAVAANGNWTAMAQTSYPSKPIRILVGYSAGGGVDVITRLFATRLSAALGQPVIVDNRPGAAGQIARDAAANAAPDGYTLFAGDTSLLVSPHLQPKSTFDATRAFSWVASLFEVPLAIIVNNDLPAKTPSEFVDLLKRNPAKYSFATSGVGTVHHLGFEQLKRLTNTFAVHIPYRGAAQIVPDVISGQVGIGVVSVASAVSQANAGRLRFLALLGNAKVPGAEKTPLLSEVLPGFSAVPRIYLLAPAGLPPAVSARIAAATQEVMAAPDLAAAANQQGAVPDYLGDPALLPAVRKESAMWGDLIRKQKISAE